MKEPTADQCTNHGKVSENDSHVFYAIWYPQMGGYVSKAVVQLDKRWSEDSNGCCIGGCFEAFVWHDGEFPFHYNDENPRELHHCDPEQFIRFGKAVKDLTERGRVDESES